MSLAHTVQVGFSLTLAMTERWLNKAVCLGNRSQSSQHAETKGADERQDMGEGEACESSEQLCDRQMANLGLTKLVFGATSGP